MTVKHFPLNTIRLEHSSPGTFTPTEESSLAPAHGSAQDQRGHSHGQSLHSKVKLLSLKQCALYRH